MITGLRLQGFRSYIDDSFEFGPGVNIIVGPNASGKTNLLEAVLVAAQGKSYRASDTQLIHYNAPWARLDADTPSGPRVVKLISKTDATTKEYLVDNNTYRRLPVAKKIPVIVFEPNHLLLLGGSPELRREYLDTILEQTTPGYAATRRAYRRALSQRNTLLKKEGVQKNDLFVWDVRLSQLGAEIAAARFGLVDRLLGGVGDLYRHISSSRSEVHVSYFSKCDTAQYASDMLRQLEASLYLDLARGFTGVGPHRDDMVVSLDNHSIESAASRGEVRTLLLALKILELQIIEQHTAQKPILLLDDVFSELDSTRRSALTAYIETHQTFVTTTDADVAAAQFTSQTHTIPLLWRSR